MCSDDWNSTHSDLACQALGYANSEYTEHTYSKSLQQDDVKFLRLKTEGNSQKSKLLSRLEPTETCNNVVSIACQEFSKYIHLLITIHLTTKDRTIGRIVYILFL